MSLAKKPPEEIGALLDEAKQHTPLGSTRYHHKDPDKHYRIIDIVFDTGTKSPMIIYLALYNDITFSRLSSVFLETVTNENNEQISRFTRIP